MTFHIYRSLSFVSKATDLEDCENLSSLPIKLFFLQKRWNKPIRKGQKDTFAKSIASDYLVAQNWGSCSNIRKQFIFPNLKEGNAGLKYPDSIWWKLEIINPFQPIVPFLYPLKTSEKCSFSDVFRGYRNGKLSWNGLHDQSDRIIEKPFTHEVAGATRLRASSNPEYLSKKWMKLFVVKWR